MSTKQYKQQAYECYNDEVAQVEEEYEDGKITCAERDRYLDNLYSNLMSDLSDEGE